MKQGLLHSFLLQTEFYRICRTHTVVAVSPGPWDAARIMTRRTTPDENALFLLVGGSPA